MDLSCANTPRPAARVTAHGVAEIAGITPARVQELARQRRNAQRLAETGTPEQRRVAKRYLRDDALPAPVRVRRPQAWSAAAVRAWAERTGRTRAGVPQRKTPPGRPAGGPAVMRRTRAVLHDRLAAFDDVTVDATLLVSLREVLDRTYVRFRARGEDTEQARESAAQVAAQALGCDIRQARKVVLMVALGRRRPQLGLLAEVVVPEGSRARLLGLLQVAVPRWRAAGATVGQARAGAVEDVAAATGVDALVVWKVLLEAVYALM